MAQHHPSCPQRGIEPHKRHLFPPCTCPTVRVVPGQRKPEDSSIAVLVTMTDEQRSRASAVAVAALALKLCGHHEPHAIDVHSLAVWIESGEDPWQLSEGEGSEIGHVLRQARHLADQLKHDNPNPDSIGAGYPEEGI